MPKYYGFMVSELTGEVDELKTVECKFKPSHETCGFSFAKWFTDKEEMIKTKKFIIEKIKERQMK